MSGTARYSEPIFCEALLAAPISDGMWEYVVSRFYPQRWMAGMAA